MMKTTYLEHRMHIKDHKPLACMKLCLRSDVLSRGVSLNESGRSDSSWAKDEEVTPTKVD
jgi:hypothetical protein